ncbi:MAG: Tm-1-like ATP-binding domain-containing protein [Planctomycetes bacterium]|nr:Tm-1-like ATP-binding domain-containing protein [Planctomycetota bacterium]
MSRTIVLIATLDTKGREAAFLRDCIRARRHRVLLVDAGVQGRPAVAADVTRAQVARAAGRSLRALAHGNDRGTAVAAMAEGVEVVVRRLYARGQLDAVFGIGGSAGTTIATQAMRALPVGVPKLMVSTLASGNTRPYVGTKDITMMYSVVDISGLNRVSRAVFSNAAAAVSAMASARRTSRSDLPLLAATMFGVTTPCVEKVRAALESPEAGYEMLVFHATGTGGQAMEGLIRDGLIAGVLDITTTELADELVGGVLSAGPHRLEAAGDRGIPQVVCPGAIDMVNFGPRETVPAQWAHRRFHQHNPTVTLMRTTPEENRRLGEWTAEKLNKARGPVAVVLPLRGVSQIDAPGFSFHDPEADAAYREGLLHALDTRKIQVRQVDAHINDDRFAAEVVSTFLALSQGR